MDRSAVEKKSMTYIRREGLYEMNMDEIEICTTFGAIAECGIAE